MQSLQAITQACMQPLLVQLYWFVARVVAARLRVTVQAKQTALAALCESVSTAGRHHAVLSCISLHSSALQHITYRPQVSCQSSLVPSVVRSLDARHYCG